VTKDDDYVK